MTQTAAPSYQSMSKSQLIGIIETQQTVIADERRQNAELRWHDEIMSNRKLPIAARFAARAVRKFTQERKPCDDGYFKGYLPKMVELAGVSASTISRGIELLSSATEALDKHTEEIRDERGHVEKNVLYFRPSESFEVAADIEPTKELPKHGGNRRLPCPECGCGHRRVKRQEECAACGHEFFKGEHIIYGEEDESLQVATDPQGEEIADDPESLQLATLPVNTGVLPCNETSVEICPPVATCNGLPPAELRALPIWCPRRGKVPYQTQGKALQPAKSDTPATWSTYEAAQKLVEDAVKWNFRDKFDGIGFMCDGSFVGIDLDHCRGKETGEIAPWAQAIIDRFPPTYGYITPSQEGVRLLILAEKPGERCKQGDIEIYQENRFFCWTPQQLPGTPITIESGQEALTALYHETFPPQAPRREATPVFTPAIPLDDDVVLSKVRACPYGAKFEKLWSGDGSDYLNQSGVIDDSRADIALCGMLAYWTGGDPVAMERLFKQSGLYRSERWYNRARSGELYGEGTIRIAIEGLAA